MKQHSQKLLTLLLVTSLVTAMPSAHAIKLYGQFDQGLSYQHQSRQGQANGIPFSTNQHSIGVQSFKDQSYVGIYAEEPLGKGNKVFIQLEHELGDFTPSGLSPKGGEVFDKAVIGIGG